MDMKKKTRSRPGNRSRPAAARRSVLGSRPTASMHKSGNGGAHAENRQQTRPKAGAENRIVRGGLIQMSNPLNDPAAPVSKVADAMLEKHLPIIEEAGKRGVQILCLQEVFHGPYFCPGQDAKWCDIAEPIPGPTIERMQKLAKKHAMAMIVPIYEREMAGVYYNNAAVPDTDGSYLGNHRKNHMPNTAGFW